MKTINHSSAYYQGLNNLLIKKFNKSKKRNGLLEFLYLKIGNIYLFIYFL
jgi:hypothetical protein